MKNTFFDYVKFGIGFYIGWNLASRFTKSYQEVKKGGELK